MWFEASDKDKKDLEYKDAPERSSRDGFGTPEQRKETIDSLRKMGIDPFTY